jgi:integrase
MDNVTYTARRGLVKGLKRKGGLGFIPEWVVPANRIKAKKEHRVPLSDRSLAILQEMQGLSEGYVFPSRDGKGPLSSGTMLMLMGRQKQGQYTVHGFRSSFRDWAAEQTDAPDPVCEACLAHVVSDAVVKSYKRTTFFDLRAELMQAWTDYCDRPAPMRAVKAEPKKTLKLRFKSAE